MKMKSTLIAAAVAMLGFSASAQTYTQVVETNPGLEGEKDLTILLTPSNTSKRKDITATKMPGIQCQGTSDHKNVLIDNTENVSLKLFGKYGPDGQTVGVYADGSQPYIRFRYNTGNQARHSEMSRMINALKKACHRTINAAYIKIMVGPKPADATSDVITPKLVLAGASDATKEGVNSAVFKFAPITLTDETQVLFYETREMSGDLVNNDFKNEEGADVNTAYLDFYVEGVSAGQFISWMDFGMAGIAPEPKVGFETVTWRNMGFRGQQDVLPGTIFIQAEDFDAPKADQPLNRSTTCLGIGDPSKDAYGYTAMPSVRSLWNKGDLSHIRIDAAGNKTGYGIFQGYRDGYSSDNACYSHNQGFALCGMSKVDGGWGTTYGGEYLDETSNKISLEQAMDGFGAWFEYTFEMEEDGYVDISVAAATHNATSFQQVMTGGPSKAKPDNGYVTNYKKDRAEGGYDVEGLDDDFLKLYGFCYVVSFDGEDLLTNWETRPKPGARNGQIEVATWTNPFEWSDNYDVDAEGKQVNSKFLLVTPPHATFDGGNQWWPMYKNEMIKEMYDMQVGTGQFDGEGDDAKEIMGESPFKTQCDAQGENYFMENYRHRPDYANVKCSAGKHTIRVKSMGGCTVFDEIRIRAHKDYEKDFSGVKAVRNIIETEAEGPAEYFDLQGRRVMNPANGLYIVKRGNKVTKEVIK